MDVSTHTIGWNGEREDAQTFGGTERALGQRRADSSAPLRNDKRETTLKRPALGSAQQRGGGEVGKAGPIGYVEAGARMDAFGGGGVVLPGKSFDDQATSRVPFRAGGAGPIDEKTLAADRAADVTFGVGDPA